MKRFISLLFERQREKRKRDEERESKFPSTLVIPQMSTASEAGQVKARSLETPARPPTWVAQIMYLSHCLLPPKKYISHKVGLEMEELRLELGILIWAASVSSRAM